MLDSPELHFFSSLKFMSSLPAGELGVFPDLISLSPLPILDVVDLLLVALHPPSPSRVPRPVLRVLYSLLPGILASFSHRNLPATSTIQTHEYFLRLGTVGEINNDTTTETCSSGLFHNELQLLRSFRVQLKHSPASGFHGRVELSEEF